MKRLKVFLMLDERAEIFVGEIAEKDRKVFFQYHSDFLAGRFWLSPYKLPLEPDLFEHKDLEFGPIFGLFDDSLPDGWGLMLMDRYLRGRGVAVEDLSVLDRLSFLGSNTMGALVYQPPFLHDTENTAGFDLYDLYQQSQAVLTGKTRTVLAELMKAGGSPGGARPKGLAGSQGDRMISGEGILPEGYSHWIIKFNATDDFTDTGPVEYAYSMMARDCGIVMPETQLFPSEQGQRFFGTKRFDRDGNKRYHVHTFGNLIHSNFRIPSCDYELFFRIINNLTKNQQDLVRGFRQMIFNVIANNRDDHVKNLAFIMNHEGEWSLSPAYDLTFSPGPGGEHTMTINGEGKSPSKIDIIHLAEKSGLKKNDTLSVIDEIAGIVSNWPTYAEHAGVSERSLKKIHQKILSNLSYL